VRDTGFPMGITARTSLEGLPDYQMRSGRPLRPGDEGQHLIMLRESFATEELGIKTGDLLMFLFENDPGKEDDVLMQVRVVGIVSLTSEQTGLESLGNLSVLPPGVLTDKVKPVGTATVAKIDESNDAYMDHVLVALSDVPGVIAIELGALTQLAQNLLDQLKAIPTLVAWLALVAGTAIIANTVALATQERRRQIGVMKAVGLKGRRVLWMLVIENGLIGLIAGLIGAGVGFVFTVALVLVSRNPSELKQTIEFSTMGWLVLMSVVVAIGAATLSARSAAAEKPMNVLRYE
jgi:ABC-type antimicrobial peptide transport system permease subunit